MIKEIFLMSKVSKKNISFLKNHGIFGTQKKDYKTNEPFLSKSFFLPKIILT